MVLSLSRIGNVVPSCASLAGRGRAGTWYHCYLSQSVWVQSRARCQCEQGRNHVIKILCVTSSLCYGPYDNLWRHHTITTYPVCETRGFLVWRTLLLHSIISYFYSSVAAAHTEIYWSLSSSIGRDRNLTKGRCEINTKVSNYQNVMLLYIIYLSHY